MNNQEKIKIQKVLVFFYDLLSSFFKEVPQAEFILKLKDEKVFLDLNFKSADLLKDYFSSLDINNNLLSSLKELKEDYNRLFIGPNKLLAPPWESVYRSSERLVFQSAALEVREYYLKMNLVHPEILVSPDDHISLELEFMSFLCNKALEFLEKDNLKEAEKYLEIEKSFLEEHLLKWIFDFTKDIEENARTLLYKGIAKFLREFIDFHIQNLSLKEVENV